MIIDAQVHVWPPDRPDRRLGPGVGERKPYGYEQLVHDMDRAGVDRAILVPPSFDADRNDYAFEAVRAYPGRFAIMGRVALKSAGKDALAGWRDKPGMLGVRLTFHRDADRPWLTDGTADWFWPQAERHDIPVMVHAPERLAEIGAVAAHHPALKIIVDHMGFARETMDDKALPAVERMNALARHPQCLRQGLGPALLLERALSVRQPARTAAPRHRGVRAAASILGQRHHARPRDLLLPAGRDPFHRGARFPLRRRSRMDHGPRPGGMPALAGLMSWVAPFSRGR